MTQKAPRRLAGIPDAVSPDQATVYHASFREAALEEFGREFERNQTAATSTSDPEYVISPTTDGELVVIAGVWPEVERSCGRLVAPRDLLEVLLADLETTAVWCDDEDGDGLAITGHAILAAGHPMLLAVARTARVIGEVEGVSQVEYSASRAKEGEWSIDALGEFLDEHDGDAIILHASILAELGRIVAAVDQLDGELPPLDSPLESGPDGLT
jgi:hypothetical protein